MVNKISVEDWSSLINRNATRKEIETEIAAAWYVRYLSVYSPML